MITKDMKKSEIEAVLADKGDFVQIDYLNRFLKTFPPIGMRKFAYLKLARVYLNRSGFTDAAKMFNNAAINCITFREKQECHLKESKSYIRAGEYEKSNSALKKAFVEANAREKEALFADIITYYKKVGEDIERKGLPGKALKLYEKLFRMKISEDEKEEVRQKLLKLYLKLGKKKEYDMLESIGSL